MSGCGKALLVLAAIVPVLTEVVSGNMPAHALLNPKITILLLLSYSFPLLIIRELSVRWRLSVLGLFLWGLAYGFLNEGLLAQTLIRVEHVPIDKFDHYIIWGGFNLSWACLIVPWHALLAIVFPIALVHHWFPCCAEKSWMNTRWLWTLSLLLLILITFISFVRVPHPQMLGCLFVMTLLFWLGSMFHSSGAGIQALSRVPIFLVGIISYLLIFFGLIILAALRVPALLYFAAAGTVFLAFARVCSRRGFLQSPYAARLGLGFYFAATAFNVAGGIVHHSIETVISGVLLAIIFTSLVRFPRSLSPATT